MKRVFDRNIFIMLLSVMVGVIIITYFLADIMRRGQIEEIERRHSEEIKTIEKRTIDFTSAFLRSIKSIDLAREFMMDGEISFQIGYAFYKNILDEKEINKFNTYRENIIDNCSKSEYKFLNSNLNFVNSIEYFNESKEYAEHDVYLELVDLYINYSESGKRIAGLCYNMSKYLMQISENLYFANGSVCYIDGTSNLTDMFNNTMNEYLLEKERYDKSEELIESYKLVMPGRSDVIT